MLSKNIYKIVQTDNVNLMAEEYGMNFVGKLCRLQLSDNSFRLYLVDREGDHAVGPYLGFTTSDVETPIMMGIPKVMVDEE